MDGRGRAKQDARTESTKSRRIRRRMEQLPRNKVTLQECLAGAMVLRQSLSRQPGAPAGVRKGCVERVQRSEIRDSV